MKVACGVLAIISGFIGLLGGVFTTAVGVAGQAIEAGKDAQTVSNLGATAFCASAFLIVFGIVSFFKPKVAGWIIIILAVIGFISSNYFSAPVALLAGIFGVLAEKYQKANIAQTES